MGPLATIRFYLLTSDPGRLSLRLGLRVAVTLAAVCVVLIIFDHWMQLPPAALTLGMISAIQGAAQIRDVTISGRAVTRIYAAIAGFIAIAAISVVEHSLLQIDLLLLTIVFVATYARRFGSRWQAVGVFAFMCGVVGAFLKAPETDLKDIALALAVSGFTAHLVRNFVMPDVSSRDFRRVVEATLSLSQQLQRVIQSGARKDVSQWESRLRNAILICESYLPIEAKTEDAELASRMALRFLDLQLAVETAVEVRFPDAGLGRGLPQGDLQQAIEDVRTATQAIEIAVKELPEAFPNTIATEPPIQKTSLLPKRKKSFQDETFRLSLQATLACAIAMGAGELLSSQRWFWAVMTAFLIFMNAQSGGAVAIKAVNRSLGTAAGIVAGIALATLLHGNPYWTIPLVAVSIFAAFYMSRLSYVIMTFCINIAISLIYGFVGIFTPELLVLRLEETALGAAAGIFVALLILPISAAVKAKQAMSRLTSALLCLIEVITDPNCQARAKAMAAAVGAVDKAYSDVLAVCEPLQSTWAIGSTDLKTTDVMRQAYLMAHAAHLLQHDFRHTGPQNDEVQILVMIRDRLKSLADNGDAAGELAPEPGGSMAQISETTLDDKQLRYAVESLFAVLQYLASANKTASA